MATELRVRRATEDDLQEVLKLADLRRDEYRRYQSRFWRPADDAVSRQRDFFSSLFTDDHAIVLVAEVGSKVRGFIIARTLSAPPVYDPGGLTCVVDDFTVSDPADWAAAGPALLDGVRTWSAEQGAVQLVVVTAHLDKAKRAALQEARLTLASEWWVGPTAPRPPSS